MVTGGERSGCGGGLDGCAEGVGVGEDSKVEKVAESGGEEMECRTREMVLRVAGDHGRPGEDVEAVEGHRVENSARLGGEGGL